MTTEHEVVIVGGGPAGMMLAAELALARVDVAIVERRPDHVLAGSRAGGFHSRTIEVFDQRGVADRFLAEGQTAQVASFAGASLDMSDFPSRHPYTLGLWQNHIERILSGWIGELPVRIHHGCEVTAVAQDEDGVDVTLADGGALRASYVAGCDGGRSLVRRAAGIPFTGSDATRSNLIAEVELTEEPPAGVRRDAIGVHGLGALEDGRTFRAVVGERELRPSGDATLAELRAALIAVFETDFGAHSPVWISRFTDAARQAEAYRAGRVLLAGDAAHIHYPVGGQGLGLGVQDAVNLGWKLARVVRGAPERLLDSYHDERHPVAARAIRHTLAQVALLRQDDRTKALFEIVTELSAYDGPRRQIAAQLSGLDIRYDLGEGHPLRGRRMPDLDIRTSDGATRVYALLHDAQPVLLNLDGAGRFADDRVKVVDATCDGPWELPVAGTVSAPAAVLIRPDGYVAWADDGDLADALQAWS